MIANKERLMRANDGSNPSSHLCSLGYCPRKGKEARRARDCTIDCSDFEKCEAKRLQSLERGKKCKD